MEGAKRGADIPGEERVALPADGGGGGIDEDGETVEELADVHRPGEVIAETLHPALVVDLHGLGGVVAGGDGLQHELGGNLASLHGVVNALTGEGIDHASSVTDDEEVVARRGGHATKTEGTSLMKERE